MRRPQSASGADSAFGVGNRVAHSLSGQSISGSPRAYSICSQDSQEVDMSTAPSDRVSSNGLTVAAYAGDGDVLLAFSLDDSVLKQNDLAGFSIQCTPPTGQPFYLQNRLNYSQPVTS